ncbi:MAG: MBL fold metallo-hydrolase [Ruminococcaceae bacterium]|nr:MBL fold metallo-hydrolase [Oscillospiraceae bacterium]
MRFQSFLSGSSGNCTFVTDGTVHILVDCGANGKYITECLRRIGIVPNMLSGILITHEHRDHISGAGILSRRFNLPIYATEKTWEVMADAVGEIKPENYRLTEKEMNIKDLCVRSFSISHDAADPVGYSFLQGQEKLTVATDLGCVDEVLFKQLKGSHSVIIEANHDEEMLQKGPYPYPLKKRISGDRGHLSNTHCGELCVRLAQSGTKSFWLGHLSLENNTPQLAYRTVADAMQEEQLLNSTDLTLNVLPRFWIE